MIHKKNAWTFTLFLLAGIVLGGFVALVTAQIPWLSWLGYGQIFGLESPLVLDLGIIVLTFGLTIKITIAGILGMILGIIMFKLL